MRNPIPSTRWALLAVALFSVLLLGCKKYAPAPATVEPKPVDPCAGSQVLTQPTCEGDNLSAEEQQLVDMINAHRRDAGLAPIPVSPSLVKVANRHARDLIQNVGQLSHSWSDCAYASGNLATFPCMWGAPKRLGTRYSAVALEIAHEFPAGATAKSAFDNWSHNQLNNDMLLSRGKFEKNRWQALGVAIRGNYALAWLGQDPEPN